jgi:hypothetical protein
LARYPRPPISEFFPIHGGKKIFGGDNLAISSFDVSWPNVRLLAFSQPRSTAARRG